MSAALLLLITWLTEPTPELGGGGGGGGSLICCHYAADGNLVCTLPTAGECQSGDKAVVCRYGVWANEDGSYWEGTEE